MERNYKDYLFDIIDSIKKIEKFTEKMSLNKFKKDIKTIYAVIRALEIIGEAAKNIPDEIKNNYSQIPWRNITGMRDKLIHGYFGVVTDVVWETIRNDLPKIKPFLIEIYNKY